MIFGQQVIFQLYYLLLTFNTITVALVSSAVIERIKLEAWLIFVVLWITFVYSPIAHGFGIVDFYQSLDC